MGMNNEHRRIDSEQAARRIVALVAATEPIDGLIHIERINAPFLFEHEGMGREFGVGIRLAVEKGWIELEGGVFVRLLKEGHHKLT